ncbi:hypothetical protein COV11_02350 [Candidatus Woesearchaeota archaeon CG10_big_fil_rev_8_21_14_0_10_30_7]|nr:MAG: hypothetical protein COV11_02350 [Candidatus Woesearchaeota archaeon CG10_big_fil_rev_8_21_14_0_10_30_7]
MEVSNETLIDKLRIVKNAVYEKLSEEELTRPEYCAFVGEQLKNLDLVQGDLDHGANWAVVFTVYYHLLEKVGAKKVNGVKNKYVYLSDNAVQLKKEITRKDVELLSLLEREILPCLTSILGKKEVTKSDFKQLIKEYLVNHKKLNDHLVEETNPEWILNMNAAYFVGRYENNFNVIPDSEKPDEQKEYLKLLEDAIKVL